MSFRISALRFAFAPCTSALLVACFVATAHSDSSIMSSVGSIAPDFVYASTPYGWRHLGDLAGPAGTVLVIDPTPGDLLALERSASSFESAGIRPVAVLRETGGACWRHIVDMGLSYSLLSDRHGVIAQAFGVAETDSSAGEAHWFLIDMKQQVRSEGREGIANDDFAARLAITLAEGTASTDR